MEFRPLTPERWTDFTTLFGRNGAASGCWCMWWRQTRAEFDRDHGERNKRAMKRIVDSGEVPGIIGYKGDEPVGWCSVAPREQFPSLDRSRVLKRLDDKPVWSLVCLFVHRDHRGEGVGLAMAKAAVAYARSQGAKIIEAYPTAPRGRKLDPVPSFMGTPALFAKAGFKEVARPSDARVIMRRGVRPARR